MAIRIGTAGNDNLVGTDLNDFMYGGAGDDFFDGGAGSDKMSGDEGNDTFMGGAGADAMTGGSGIDTVDYSHSHDGVNVSLRNGTGSGGDAEGDTLGGIENLIGSDNMRNTDKLTGDSANNILDGRNGADVLAGNEGNDTLIGGAGYDTMTGGADADTFVFYTDRRGGPSSVHGDGRDVITDFQVGVDVLEFTGNGVNSLDELSFAKVGNDTVISYGTWADTITLVGVGLEELKAHQAHDFLFV